MPAGPFTIEAAEMSRGDVEVSISGLGTQPTKKPRIQGPWELTPDQHSNCTRKLRQHAQNLEEVVKQIRALTPEAQQRAQTSLTT